MSIDLIEEEAKTIFNNAALSLRLPPCAIHDLLTLGVCVRCIFRLFGVRGPVYSCSLITSSMLCSFLKEKYDEIGFDLKDDELYCCICLGVLQFACDCEEGRSVEGFVGKVGELIEREGYMLDGFCLEISVPVVIVVNERAFWLYMKRKYGCEMWFKNKFPSEQITVKDALRLSVTSPLEKYLNVKSGVDSFRIRFTYTHLESFAKLQLSLANDRGCKRRKIEATKDVVIDSNGSSKKNSNEYVHSESDTAILRAVDSLQDPVFTELFPLPPQKVSKPCQLTTTCLRMPMYIGGRYLKFSRKVSQSRWIIDDERMGEASVEEIVGSNALSICKGDSYKFHAAGREDIDVRMLGSGRPFLIEVLNARCMPSMVDVQQIADTINYSSEKYVEVRNLKVAGSEVWDLMREGEAEKQKQYAAVVWTSRALTDENLDLICSVKNMDIRTLDCIDHFSQVRSWRREDERVQAVLQRAGFIHFSRLDYVRLDRSLITALVERWRPETWSFHFRVGEMAITLQDVSVILGLRVDGPAVIRRLDILSWEILCMETLGRVPPDMRGGSIKLTWLREAFVPPSVDATAVEIEQYSRGYILHQIGTSLFPDTTRNKVHCKWLTLLADLDFCGTLSWGSAVLAFLYSELSAAALKERDLIGGCLTLLQLWSWTRIGVGRPTLSQQTAIDQLAPFGFRFNVTRTWDRGPDRSIRFYRDQFDMMEEVAVIWCPYPEAMLALLPALCTIGDHIWRARTTILCWGTVALHLPDRVLRQFDLRQHIPDVPWQIGHVDYRGRSRADWPHIHAIHLASWDLRAEQVVVERLPRTPLADYQRWYWSITRRFILTECEPVFAYTPSGPVERDLLQSVYRLDDIAQEVLSRRRDPMDGWTSATNIIRGILNRHPFRRPDAPLHPQPISYLRRRHDDAAAGASQPGPSTSGPSQPGPSQPAPSQPGPSQPAPSQPTTQPQDVLEHSDLRQYVAPPARTKRRTPRMIRRLRD